MAQKTDAQLLTEAQIIRNETVKGANTAQRVGDMLVDVIDSKVNTNSVLVYTALLSQGIDGAVTILSELENTIGEVSIGGSSLGGIQIGLLDITLEANKMIGFCYSGDDDNATYKYWIVNNEINEIRLAASESLEREQICIRVDIKVYN